jgi:hypothetical protein
MSYHSKSSLFTLCPTTLNTLRRGPGLSDHNDFRQEVIQKLDELRGERGNSGVQDPMNEPEPAEHEATFRAEVLQELIELRNEMRNLMESNTRLLQQIQTPPAPGNEPPPA